MGVVRHPPNYNRAAAHKYGNHSELPPHARAQCRWLNCVDHAKRHCSSNVQNKEPAVLWQEGIKELSKALYKEQRCSTNQCFAILFDACPNKVVVRNPFASAKNTAVRYNVKIDEGGVEHAFASEEDVDRAGEHNGVEYKKDTTPRTQCIIRAVEKDGEGGGYPCLVQEQYGEEREGREVGAGEAGVECPTTLRRDTTVAMLLTKVNEQTDGHAHHAMHHDPQDTEDGVHDALRCKGTENAFVGAERVAKWVIEGTDLFLVLIPVVAWALQTVDDGTQFVGRSRSGRTRRKGGCCRHRAHGLDGCLGEHLHGVGFDCHGEVAAVVSATLLWRG
eukprot:PhM_4_TR18720/c1_g1_i1/m.11732